MVLSERTLKVILNLFKGLNKYRNTMKSEIKDMRKDWMDVLELENRKSEVKK